uniref:Uncharacterized protein n=1 Tax=Myotis myotis TaxID=51298 RepID=A0A7J7SC50_MYOMY|nr:hypothetical protein mMyoMyo1_009502 [Myotis myotis]
MGMTGYLHCEARASWRTHCHPACGLGQEVRTSAVTAVQTTGRKLGDMRAASPGLGLGLLPGYRPSVSPRARGLLVITRDKELSFVLQPIGREGGRGANAHCFRDDNSPGCQRNTLAHAGLRWELRALGNKSP